MWWAAGLKFDGNKLTDKNVLKELMKKYNKAIKV